MGNAISIFLRLGESTARVAGLTLAGLHAASCFANGESFTYSILLDHGVGTGWANCSVTAVAQSFDLEDRFETAIEPYTHELSLLVQGTHPDTYETTVTSQAWHTFRQLQRLNVPLLLADEDARAFADFLPGRVPPERIFKTGTQIARDTSTEWMSELYTRTAAPQPRATEPHSFVAFTTTGLLCIAPATNSGLPSLPAFVTGTKIATAELIAEIVDAASSFPAIDGSSAAVYASIADRFSMSVTELESAEHRVLEPGSPAPDTVIGMIGA